jgi:predicted alpha/beta hydrolase
MKTSRFSSVKTKDLYGVLVPEDEYMKVKNLADQFLGMTSNDTPAHLARKWAAKHAVNCYVTALYQVHQILNKMKKDALELFLED